MVKVRCEYRRWSCLLDYIQILRIYIIAFPDELLRKHVLWCYLLLLIHITMLIIVTLLLLVITLFLILLGKGFKWCIEQCRFKFSLNVNLKTFLYFFGELVLLSSISNNFTDILILVNFNCNLLVLQFDIKYIKRLFIL